MANGQQLGLLNLQKFEAWKATMTDQDYKNMAYRGQLKRSELSAQTGICVSAFRQNDKLARALSALENSLRDSGVLDVKNNEDKRSGTSPSPSKQRDKNASKVRILESENNKLRSDLLEAKAKLARLSELEEVISQMGIIL